MLKAIYKNDQKSYLAKTLKYGYNDYLLIFGVGGVRENSK